MGEILEIILESLAVVPPRGAVGADVEHAVREAVELVGRNAVSPLLAA